MYLSPLFLVTLSLMAVASSQNCYWPNGETAPELMACSVAPGNEAAACCYAFHYCMTNGLCLSPTEGTWYRGGCTDDEYQKTGCPQICEKSRIIHSHLIHGYNTDMRNPWLTHCSAAPNFHAGVWACANRIFACDKLNNCPRENFTVGAYRAVMNAALSTDLFDSTATATMPVTASLSSGAAHDPTCTSTQQASRGITTGAATGIGVGVGVPLAIAVGTLTVMLMREKKKSRIAQAGYQQQHDYSQQPGHNLQPYAGASSPLGKAEGQTIPHELADTQSRHEQDHISPTGN